MEFLKIQHKSLSDQNSKVARGSVVTPTRKSFFGSRPGKIRMDARKQQLMRILQGAYPKGIKTNAIRKKNFCSIQVGLKGN
jgi:hypothetical protein